MVTFARVLLVTTILALAAGCSTAPSDMTQHNPALTQSNETATGESDAEIRAELAKLSPEDRAAAEAQRWCAVNTGERLGGMGPPVKLVIKGELVFLCCGGCRKRAEVDPDKTLAKVEELKAKAKDSASPK